MWNADDFDQALVTLIVLAVIAGVALAYALPWLWRTVAVPLLRALVS
jgi:hypothetical protein